MAFQSAPDIAEAVINYSIEGQPAANVMNFAHTGGYNQTDIDLLAELMDLAVSDYIIPLVNSAVDYLFVKAKGLENIADLEATNATSAESGASSGTVLPSQQSYVIKFGTGFTGRSARGRFYFPPTSIAQIVDSRTVSSGYSNACVDALADLLTDLAAGGWIGVVLSRVVAGTPLTTAVGRPITDVVATNTNMDTQRRRVGK